MKRIPWTLALLLALPLGAAAQDIPLAKILVEKEDWREVAKGLPDVTLLGAEPAGSVAIYQRASLSARIGVNGKLGKSSAVPGYNHNVRVVATRAGALYSIAWGSGWVDFIPSTGKGSTLKLIGLKTPSCLTLWPDEGHLVIGEADSAYLWAVRIEKNGIFGPGDRYYSLRTKTGVKMHVAAMTIDAGYLLYACTPIGIQVFDPTGRLSGVIAAPSKETMTAITIGGAKADELYVAAGDRIYARKIQGRAAYTLKK